MNSSVQICSNTRAKSHGIKSHDIAWSSKYTVSSACRWLVKCRKASYKTYQHVTNKSEKTWTHMNKPMISHHILIIKSSFQRDESWEEDHQHQPHGSSRPLPHPWAFPQQSDTLIHRIVFVHHMANPCTYHGNSRNPMWYLVLHSIVWHLIASLALWGMVLAWAGSRGLEGLWIDMDLCCKSSPNSDQTTTNTYKQFQTLPYPIFHIQLTHAHTRSLVRKEL